MSDRYASERYDPALAHCSQLALSFDGSFLSMTGGNTAYKYPAVSGKRLGDGKFDYSVAAQKSPNSGLIPEGTYWINPAELWELAWWKKPFVSETGWGKYRITIHPFTTTVTHSRGGFFIHGGQNPGSAGCIDLTSHIEKFINDLRKEGALRKCQIHLTVNYPKGNP
jgi:Protein of unknown function (DUF2778)